MSRRALAYGGSGGGGGGGPVAMGGDVTGDSDACTVVALQGSPVDASPPSSGDVLTWDGAAWAPTPGASVSANEIDLMDFLTGTSNNGGNFTLGVRFRVFDATLPMEGINHWLDATVKQDWRFTLRDSAGVIVTGCDKTVTLSAAVAKRTTSWDAPVTLTVGEWYQLTAYEVSGTLYPRGTGYVNSGSTATMVASGGADMCIPATAKVQYANMGAYAAGDAVPNTFSGASECAPIGPAWA